MTSKRHQPVEPRSVRGRAVETSANLLGSAPRDPAAARHIDPQWVGYYRVLLALRRRLADDRAEELAELGSPLEPHSLSQADTASDEFDHDMLLAELSTVQDRMFEVDAALRRIEDHTYGVCELTGCPIPPERLRAVPWTRFTAAAARRLEHEEAIGRPHLGQLGSVRRPRVATLAPAEPVEDEQEISTDERSAAEASAGDEVEAEADRRPEAASTQNREAV